MNGQDLLNYCKSNDTSEQMLCVGYIGGIFDEYTSNIKIEADVKKYQNPDSTFKSCNSANRTLGQIRDVLVNFIEINPKFRDWTAPGMLAMGIDEWLDCGLFRDMKQYYIDQGWKF